MVAYRLSKGIRQIVLNSGLGSAVLICLQKTRSCCFPKCHLVGVIFWCLETLLQWKRFTPKMSMLPRWAKKPNRQMAFSCARPSVACDLFVSFFVGKDGVIKLSIKGGIKLDANIWYFWIPEHKSAWSLGCCPFFMTPAKKRAVFSRTSESYRLGWFFEGDEKHHPQFYRDFLQHQPL